MSIQVRCNGCERVIDALTESWYEAAYFDPREEEEEREIEEGREEIQTATVYHFCSPDCVSVWGMRLSMEKNPGPVL